MEAVDVNGANPRACFGTMGLYLMFHLHVQLLEFIPERDVLWWGDRAKRWGDCRGWWWGYQGRCEDSLGAFCAETMCEYPWSIEPTSEGYGREFHQGFTDVSFLEGSISVDAYYLVLVIR